VLIGIVGGGQLGRMLALSGVPLGFRFRVLDPSPAAAASVVAQQIVGDYDDPAGIARLADGADVVTYEFENVPVEAARKLATHVPVYPPPEALEAAQDRLAEKMLFERIGIPVHAYTTVDSVGELRAALDHVGLPALVKTRRLGYDGKGQVIVRRASDAAEAWVAVGGQPSLVETLVDFDREVSILAVRACDGETSFYPLVENHHRQGILRLSIAPAPDLPPELQAAAEMYAARMLDELDYVGVLAIELFQVGAHLLANEMAPRVHNSGHWTIEGAETSQFENHIRAVAGLPMGSTAVRGQAAMLNIVGRSPQPDEVLAVPGAHLHLYGKPPRPGRKLGHVTARVNDPHELTAAVARLRSLPGVG